MRLSAEMTTRVVCKKTSNIWMDRVWVGVVGPRMARDNVHSGAKRQTNLNLEEGVGVEHDGGKVYGKAEKEESGRTDNHILHEAVHLERG